LHEDMNETAEIDQHRSMVTEIQEGYMGDGEYVTPEYIDCKATLRDLGKVNIESPNCWIQKRVHVADSR